MKYKPKTPSDLAMRVLKHPTGGLRALLELTDRDEREWLELKAAAYPENGKPAAGRTIGDYEWHVAKAVVALANSNGGVVLLGVDDNGGPIGLKASDPSGVRERKGAEAFRRSIIMQKLLNPSKGWKTGKNGTFKLCNPQLFERLVTLEETRCGTESVLAIVVDPAPKDIGFVEVEHIIEGRPAKRKVFARKRGAIGEVFELAINDPAVLKAHENQRFRQQHEIGATWERFLSQGGLARPLASLEPDIRSYLRDVTDQLSELGKKFIPLFADRLSGPSPNPKRKKTDIIPGLGDEWLEPNQKPNTRKKGGLPDAGTALNKPSHTDATEILRLEDRAILVGEAGSGKSACFGKIALDAANSWLPGNVWPLLVSLSEYNGNLGNLLQVKSGINWEDLYPQIAQGNTVLYLDAFNECPDELFDHCNTEIAALLAECPKARVFISTRTSNNPMHFGLPTFAIKPMAHEQQRSFLVGFVNEEEKAQFILAKLHSQPGARAVASSPILLRIIAEVARETNDIPAGRALLYRRFFESWYRREKQKADFTGTAISWSQDVTLQALTELAFQSRQKGIFASSGQQVQDILARILGEDVDSFVDWASQGLILTRDNMTGRVTFWHETIQEYFCAEYLIARDNDIGLDTLAGNPERKMGTWAMPLAFSFELLATPSKELINAAWAVEPLITAASMRDSWHFIPRNYNGDAWTRGVLRALLGQDVSQEAREITVEARLPPKYPISQYLITTLRSQSFWYSAQSHTSRFMSLDHLKKLFSDRRFPWIELLPQATVGYEALNENLSPAMKAVIGITPPPKTSEILATANTSELCLLRRMKIVSSKEFLTWWARSLEQTTDQQLELDLVDILRTEKDQIRKLIPRMLQLYRRELQHIAREKHLSIRILSILVRDGVLSSESIRHDTDWLESIISRMSPINAVRLADQGVVLARDLTPQDRARLLHDIWFGKGTPKARKMDYLRDLFSRGFLANEDISSDFAKVLNTQSGRSSKTRNRGHRGFRYTSEELADGQKRQRFEKELKEKRWTVVVKNVNHEKNFGFASHPDFDKDLHFRVSDIRSNGGSLSTGKTLDVFIAPMFNRAKREWGFAIRQGHNVD